VSCHPLGNQIYISKDDRLTVFGNFEDHFTIILKIDKNSISNSINEMEDIINILQEHCKSFSFHPDVGFLTANPKYSGSGASLAYFI
jgi:protein-arginine kinase